MITLESVKILLKTAGFSRLKIDFDDERKIINAEYVFRWTPGTKQITYQEIIDRLTIGLPEVPVDQAAALTQKLTELSGEIENNGLERT